MQTLKLQVQHINSKRDLLAWLMERLSETGPFEPVSADLDRHCEHFIEDLIEGELCTAVTNQATGAPA